MFRIRQSGPQSEKPKWLSSIMFVVLVVMAIMLMLMMVPIMLMMVIVFVVMMVVITIVVKNNVEVGKDAHVILVDTHGDYQPW